MLLPLRCAAFIAGNDLNHRGPAKSLHWLGRRIGIALLGSVEGLTDLAPDFARKAAQVFAAGSNPLQWPIHVTSIPEYVYWYMTSWD